MEYRYEMVFWIEADSVEEAEELYEAGEFFPDHHRVYAVNADGTETEIEIA